VSHSEEIQLSAHTHKRPDYVLVFIGLLALTVFEVGITYLQIPETIITVALLAFMAFKVLLVALFYMHLRVDSKWFAYIFLIPLPFVMLILTALYFEAQR
jgi:caa(3)-type oxidase subunit IV